MQLSPARFNHFLAKVGQHVTWRKANQCPCRDPYSGAPSPTCHVCTNGILWELEVKTYLALSSMKLQQAWAQFGIAERGDVVCTLPSDAKLYRMGEYDRVRMDDSSQPFSMQFTNTGPVKLNFSVLCIDRLFWLDSGQTVAIDGTIPTQKDDGTLAFGARPPPANTQFTITGRRKPEYFVFQEFPQDRAHFGGEDLPRRVILRNLDLFKRAN